jgi:hypothetical protein
MASSWDDDDDVDSGGYYSDPLERYAAALRR